MKTIPSSIRSAAAHPHPGPGPAPGLPWHWLLAAIAVLAGAYGAWTLWGHMPAAVPLPTTGGNSGEIIVLKEVADVANPALLRHRQVQLVGRFAPEHTVVLKGRNMAGRSGLYVATPLVERKDTGLAVLVLRGWVPEGTPNLSQWLKTYTPRHDVVIHGRLALPELGLAEDAARESGFARKNLSLPAYSAEIRVPLLPLVVLEEYETTTAPKEIRDGLLKRRWPELYPQDRSLAGKGWMSLAAALVLVFAAYGMWRKRKSIAQVSREPEPDSTH